MVFSSATHYPSWLAWSGVGGHPALSLHSSNTPDKLFIIIVIIYLLERTNNIQTSRSTKAKYAITGVLIKHHSSIHANF